MGNVNAIRGAFRPVSLCVLLAGALAACASPPPPFPDLPRLTVATSFGSRNLCGLGVSPPIKITKAPPATAQYRLRMINTDVLFQTPWETTQPAKAEGFAEGDIADYEAPCVGELRLYTYYRYQQYRLEVLALDAQNRPLAYGSATVPVYSVGTMVDRERAAQRQGSPGTPEPQRPSIIGPVAPDDYDTLGPQVNPALIPQIPVPQP